MEIALNATWVNNAVDIAAIVVIAIIAGRSAKKGFVACFFGFISTIVALILAFVLAKPVLGWTNGLFGLEGWLENAITGMLSKITGFDIDVSSVGIEAALADKNLPAFLVNTLSDLGNDQVPQGTTLAMLAGGELGTLAATLISGIAVFALAKIILKILEKIFSSIVENLPIVGTLNNLLGFLVGALQGLLIVCGIIAVIALFPSTGIVEFFNECTLVGWLYNNNPLHVILSWIIN